MFAVKLWFILKSADVFDGLLNVGFMSSVIVTALEMFMCHSVPSEMLTEQFHSSPTLVFPSASVSLFMFCATPSLYQLYVGVSESESLSEAVYWHVRFMLLFGDAGVIYTESTDGWVFCMIIDAFLNDDQSFPSYTFTLNIQCSPFDVFP